MNSNHALSDHNKIRSSYQQSEHCPDRADRMSVRLFLIQLFFPR